MSWLPKQKVVVPIDFSEESLAALQAALALVPGAAHLHAIYVLPHVEYGEPGIMWDAVDEGPRREHAEQAFREKLADQPALADVQFHVAFGDPGHEVAEFAQREGADLIVMPSHGRRGLSRLLIGSVAERVVRLAHCPVLVLRK
jgi:nucleotide-binding universal stress UspA family protein